MERRERRYGGERRGYAPRFPPKPVEVGKEYDVEIQESSRRGEGIARIKGLVCFVPNTKPGDKVRIKITRISRRFAEAESLGKATGKIEPEAETAAEAEEARTDEEETEEEEEETE